MVTDLDAAIRARLGQLDEDLIPAIPYGPVEVPIAALTAVLDLHRQAYALVWDVPRSPSGEPRLEPHPWCVCQEHDGMTDEERWPCPTVRAIAEKLGVEVDG